MKRIDFLKLTLSLVILLSFPAPSGAADGFDFKEEKQDKGLGLPISGRISLEGARQLADSGRWILAGASLNLIFDFHDSSLGQVYGEGFACFNFSYSLEDDSQRIVDKYGGEAILRELFWKKNFGGFTLSLGKIIEDLTVMDMLQIIDKTSVINREDYFFADPEELKLGQNMVKLEYFFGGDTQTGIIFTPYPAFDRITDSDHPYALVRNQILYDSDDNREPEGSLYVSRSYPKGLLAGYVGRFHNRTPILEAPPSSPGRVLGLHEPYWSAGGGFNLALEPFLLKGEAVYNFDRALQAGAEGLPQGFVKQDQVELALGLEYNSGGYGLFTVELSAASAVNNDARLAMNRARYLGAFSWSDEYYNDKLKLRLVTNFLESLGNIISRLQAEYYFTDTFSVTAKYTRFDINQKTDEYGFMKDYDRIDLYLNFDFNLN